MDIRLLGPLQVLHEGRDVTPVGRRQRWIFLRLALSANEVVSVDRLAEDVFEEEPRPQDPIAALYVHVSRLRKALKLGRDANGGIVKQSPGYRLVLGPDDVDAWRFERLVGEAAVALENRPDVAADTLELALALWRGPPLVDVAFASFARAEIVRLEELRLTVTENLFEARLALGAAHEVVTPLQALVDEHPLRERLAGQLMRALYLDGRQTEALRAYQGLRRMLDEQVGLAPGPELQQLEAALLRHDPDLRAGPAPAGGAGPARRRSRHRPLPTLLTRFVGRREACEEVTKRLGEARLVTLTGMAGVGKTRLALEVAGDIERSMVGPVWVVELSSLADPALVEGALAAAVGVGDRPASPMGGAVGDAIGSGPALVVLDNCEHLLDACAEVVCDLVERCANLRVLATSQEPLGIPGEVAWPVPPLTVPAEDQDNHEEMEAYEAVELFCDRARLVRPDFALHDDNATAVATICRRLDGLPLAIELAAAGLAQLAANEIAELLDDRFNLLTGGSRWVATRHQTLLAAVEWSHGLLTDPEQVLLRRLSVFAGGATLGAVEEVCGGDDLAVSQVYPVLGRLVAKSVVVADTAGRQARYRLLETIRHYAADRLLEAGEHAVVAERHGRWCVGLAERAEAEMDGPDQRAWHDRLRADHDNVRAALGWAVGEHNGEIALRLSSAMTAFWWYRSHYWQEGLEWVARALAVDVDEAVAFRARALCAYGRMLVRHQDNPAAADAAATSLAMCRSASDVQGQARALLVLGYSGESREGFTALEALDHSARLAREVGDASCESEAIALLGLARLRRGELTQARPLLEQAVGASRREKHEIGLVAGLLGLATVNLLSGAFEAADGLAVEALRWCRANSMPETSFALLVLAQLAVSRGDNESARSLVDEALEIARRLYPPRAFECFWVLGRMDLDAGEDLRAEEHFHQAVGVLQEMGTTSIPIMVGLAEVHLRKGDAAAAKSLLDQALEAARIAGNVLDAAEVVFGLGELALAEGDVEEARACHCWALEQRSHVGNLPAAVRSMERVAHIATRVGSDLHAVRVLAASDTLRKNMGLACPPARRRMSDADLEALGRRLDPAELSAAWDEGASFSLDAALTCASEVCIRPAPRRSA